MRLKGKAALVTGAGRGIGRAIALALAREGCDLAICSRTTKELYRTAREIQKLGREVFAAPCDVRKASQVQKFVEGALRNFGKIDILVNNAGVAIWKRLDETSEDEWDKVLDTNLKGPFLFCKFIVPHMRKRKEGVIVNISSGAGKKGYGNFSVYCASKFGVVGLTESLADELSKEKVRVYAVCPGGVATKMYFELEPEAREEQLLKPEEVAELVVKLCLPDSKTKSGSAVDIYKGM
jgi:3-oxoacyl-[acyl-carrier protein] reductase